MSDRGDAVDSDSDADADAAGGSQRGQTILPPPPETWVVATETETHLDYYDRETGRTITLLPTLGHEGPGAWKAVATAGYGDEGTPRLVSGVDKQEAARIAREEMCGVDADLDAPTPAPAAVGDYDLESYTRLRVVYQSVDDADERVFTQYSPITGWSARRISGTSTTVIGSHLDSNREGLRHVLGGCLSGDSGARPEAHTEEIEELLTEAANQDRHGVGSSAVEATPTEATPAHSEESDTPSAADDSDAVGQTDLSSFLS